FQYLRWGNAAGHVRDEVQQGLANVTISVYRSSGAFLGSTVTNSTGLYSISLPRGDVVLNHSTVAKHTSDQAKAATITSGQTTTIDFVLARFGTLTGYALDKFAQPLQDAQHNTLTVTVKVIVGGATAATATTDTNGYYTVDVAPAAVTIAGDTVSGFDQ